MMKANMIKNENEKLKLKFIEYFYLLKLVEL